MNIEITDPFYQQKLSVVDILFRVVDPELDINVIDLGLIYNIVISRNPNKIAITMTLSTPSCPVGGMIKSNVEQVITEVFPDDIIIVDLVFEPVWTLEMVTEAGKSALGW